MGVTEYYDVIKLVHLVHLRPRKDAHSVYIPRCLSAIFRDVRSFPEVVFAEETRGDPRSRAQMGGYGRSI